MGNGKAGTLCQLLHRLYSKVGSDCPVSTEDNGHYDKKCKVVVPKSGKGKEDEPVCRCRLLYLYMSCRKQGTTFCNLVETDKKNVYDKGDEKKSHYLGKSFPEDFFYTGGNRILSVVWIDNGCGQIESVL